MEIGKEKKRKYCGFYSLFWVEDPLVAIWLGTFDILLSKCSASPPAQSKQP